MTGIEGSPRRDRHGGPRAGQDPPGPGTARDRRSTLRRQLDGHRPVNDTEIDHLARLRAALDTLDAPFDESAQATHVTGSAIVLPTDGTPRTVLVHHKRLRRWLQPGGHVEGDEAVHEAAVREVGEETGLTVAHPASGARLVHVHVHDGGRDHLHLDVRYALLADPAQPFAPGVGESRRIGWFDLDRLEGVAERSVTDAVRVARALVSTGTTWR